MKEGSHAVDFATKIVLKRLTKHQKSVHKGRKEFKSDICDKNFLRKKHLKAHTKSVQGGKKPFQCAICDYKFFQKSVLKNHMASVHEEMKKY